MVVGVDLILRFLDVGSRLKGFWKIKNLQPEMKHELHIGRTHSCCPCSLSLTALPLIVFNALYPESHETFVRSKMEYLLLLCERLGANDSIYNVLQQRD